MVDSWVTPEQFSAMPGFVYSPASVYQSLSIISLGARDRGGDQLNAFLRMDHQSQCGLLEYYFGDNQNSPGTWAISAWGDAKAQYAPAYLTLLSKCAGIVPRPISQSEILSWINAEIPDFYLEPPSSLTPKGVGPGDGLMAVGLSRFQFDWAQSAYKVLEGRGKFALPSGEITTVPYRQAVGEFGYYQDDDLVALSMSGLRSKQQLVLITPRLGGGFSFDFFRSLNSKKVNEIVENKTVKQMDVRIPSFDLVSSWNLTDDLASYGIADVFFPGVASLDWSLPGGDPYISKVLQVSQISLGSTETNPVNANSVVISRDEPPSLAPVIYFNRAFVALVIDRETNEILAKCYVLGTK